ncbi:MAG: hypothetical protein AAFV72_24630 [Cyanobacteria bacterium J06635_1]
MNKVQELHQQAMDLAEQAGLQKLRGNTSLVQEILREALELETEAARMVADDLSAEPTRSVLHRSAATLAVECGSYRWLKS